MTQDNKNIIINYHKIRSLIPPEVKFVIATKGRSIDQIKVLLDLGHRDFGENKVQEAISKWTILKQLYSDIKLHMIGHLQTNKIKDALRIFDVIETIDSKNLIMNLSKYSLCNKIFYIQINIANEPQKTGIQIHELEEMLALSKKEKIPVNGIMCVPPHNISPEKYFAQMKEIAFNNSLDNISMGMSDDYEQAIIYGSNEVRIGRAIF